MRTPCRSSTQPRAPPTEAAVGNNRTAAAAHQPEIGKLVVRVVLDKTWIESPEIQRCPDPFRVISENIERGPAHLADRRVDRPLIVSGIQQRCVANTPDMQENRIPGGHFRSEFAVPPIGRHGGLKLRPDPLRMIREICLVLPIPQQGHTPAAGFQTGELIRTKMMPLREVAAEVARQQLVEGTDDLVPRMFERRRHPPLLRHDISLDGKTIQAIAPPERVMGEATPQIQIERPIRPQRQRARGRIGEELVSQPSFHDGDDSPVFHNGCVGGKC